MYWFHLQSVCILEGKKNTKQNKKQENNLHIHQQVQSVNEDLQPHVELELQHCCWGEWSWIQDLGGSENNHEMNPFCVSLIDIQHEWVTNEVMWRSNVRTKKKNPAKARLVSVSVLHWHHVSVHINSILSELFHLPKIKKTKSREIETITIEKYKMKTGGNSNTNTDVVFSVLKPEEARVRSDSLRVNRLNDR